MKLLHSTCAYAAEITTERIAVRILDVVLTDNNNLEEALLDLVPLRSGKILFYCPKCKVDIDPKTDLSINCVRCGDMIPTTRVFSVKPDWFLLCEKCYIYVLKKMSPERENTQINLEPIQLKIK